MEGALMAPSNSPQKSFMKQGLTGFVTDVSKNFKRYWDV